MKKLTIEQTYQLIDICQKFIKDNRISCDETISQCDHVIVNAYELISDICDCIGYYEDEDDEQT